MNLPLATLCGLAPSFGVLLTPGGGKLQSASYSRPVAVACEVSLLGESWDTTAGLSVGYDLTTSLVDSRLFTVGGRYRFFANPAWVKSAEEQVLLQHTNTRVFDPYAVVMAGLLDYTIYSLNDAEVVVAQSIQAFGAVAGAGVDWYLFSDKKSPRGVSWKGILLSGEARFVVLPVALRQPAVQAFLVQALFGTRYVF